MQESKWDRDRSQLAHSSWAEDQEKKVPKEGKMILDSVAMLHSAGGTAPPSQLKDRSIQTRQVDEIVYGIWYRSCQLI